MNPNLPEDPTLTTSEDVQLPSEPAESPEPPAPKPDMGTSEQTIEESSQEQPVADPLEQEPLPEPTPAPEELTASPTNAEVPSSVDSINIELTFEVGQQDIPLNELRSLQSGFSFEFDSPINKPITIKANGKAIGTGELLKVGDKVGVRVVDFFGNK